MEKENPNKTPPFKECPLSTPLDANNTNVPPSSIPMPSPPQDYTNNKQEANRKLPVKTNNNPPSTNLFIPPPFIGTDLSMGMPGQKALPNTPPSMQAPPNPYASSNQGTWTPTLQATKKSGVSFATKLNLHDLGKTDSIKKRCRDVQVSSKKKLPPRKHQEHTPFLLLFP